MKFEDMYSTLIDKLTSWQETIAAMLPNLVMAIVVMFVFWFLAKLAHRVVRSALDRIHTNQAARDLLATVARLATLFIGMMVALGILGLDKALASVLAGAGVIGLALGFAFQDLASNIISGFGLAMNRERPFKIGDLIETNDAMGVVDKINIRTTVVRSLDNKLIVIPNKEIYQNKLTNHSSTGTRRVELTCGVSYGDDLDQVIKVALSAIKSLECRKKDKEPAFYFQSFGDSSINFITHFWIDYKKQSDYLKAQSRAIVSLKHAFDEADIMIPFPIRTLDFGIRGGEALNHMLSSDAKE